MESDRRVHNHGTFVEQYEWKDFATDDLYEKYRWHLCMRNIDDLYEKYQWFVWEISDDLYEKYLSVRIVLLITLVQV